MESQMLLQKDLQECKRDEVKPVKRMMKCAAHKHTPFSEMYNASVGDLSAVICNYKTQKAAKTTCLGLGKVISHRLIVECLCCCAKVQNVFLTFLC